MESELEARVRAMTKEKLDLGVPCINADCSFRSTCERYYDPVRTEYKGKEAPTELIAYDDERDSCFVLRRRLQGTPEVHREWTKTTKRHRRKGGMWL